MIWHHVLLFLGVAEAVMVDKRQREKCEKFAFLRIQKTGSTTFENLIKEDTPGLKGDWDVEGMRERWRLPLAHINYLDVKEEMSPSCVVVLLRDPVERFISEFNMLRSSDANESFMLDEDQWDFAYEQLEALHKIRTNENASQALMDFINFPENPSRNRQALYLLGFKRVTCRKSPTTNNTCCGVCVKNPEKLKPSPGGFPAREYDWDQNEEELLKLAKEHLNELLTFGIADCYEESIRAMAPKLNWDPDIAVQRAATTHEREGEKQDIEVHFESNLTKAQAYKLHSGPGSDYCDSGVISNSESEGLSDCEARCDAARECRYLSFWSTGGLNWCRLTTECSSKYYQDHEITIYAKQAQSQDEALEVSNEESPAQQSANSTGKQSANSTGKQAVYSLQSGQSGEFCDTGVIRNSESDGLSDCQSRCDASSECRYISFWTTGGQNWCRLTTECSHKDHQDHEISIYAKQAVSDGNQTLDVLFRPIQLTRKRNTQYKMSALVAPEIADVIRQKNRIDDELVKYARKVFFERHGVECTSNEPTQTEKRKPQPS